MVFVYGGKDFLIEGVFLFVLVLDEPPHTQRKRGTALKSLFMKVVTKLELN
jgi:hypothetical protein